LSFSNIERTVLIKVQTARSHQSIRDDLDLIEQTIPIAIRKAQNTPRAALSNIKLVVWPNIDHAGIIQILCVNGNGKTCGQAERSLWWIDHLSLTLGPGHEERYRGRRRHIG
jgi:hypothetical protein